MKLRDRLYYFFNADRIEEDQMRMRSEIKALELAEMSALDKYAEVASALGFECHGWFCDPKARHEEIAERALELVNNKNV